MSWVDALGRTLATERTPRRIVSLVPSITETLFAFGLHQQVVGVTKFCLEPADAVADKRKVGGTKNVDVAAVLALKPDLVIANVEENEKLEVDALIDAGLTVFVTYPRTVAAAIAMMRTLAEITGSTTAASPLVGKIDAQVTLARSRGRDEAPIRAFCPIWRKPWMTIGPDTYIHDLLEVCGVENVYVDSLERYPTINLEDVAARKPDVVILPDEPYPFQRRHIAEVAAAIPGVAQSRIYLVDGKDICWYGPRIADAIQRLRGVLAGGAF